MECFCCIKSKRRHGDETSKHPPNPYTVSPNHSQPSTLNRDLQFPKVSGTGLWLGAPGIHAVTPAPAYFMHKNPPPTGMMDIPPSYLQRATSERRPQSRNPYAPSKAMFSSHNNVYLMPVGIPGHQRIYHSANLSPLPEVPPMMSSYTPMGMEIYEYTPMGASNGLASRSKLIETKHSPYMYNDNFTMVNKLERSRSDAQQFPRPAPHKFIHTKQTSSSSQDRKSQSSFKDSSVYIKDDKRKLVSSEGFDGSMKNKSSLDELHSSFYNKAFSTDSGLGKSSSSIDKPNAPHLIAMKSPKRISQSGGTPGLVSTYVSKPDMSTDIILSTNKTDDQKTQPSFSDMLDSINLPDEAEADLGHKEYSYSGVITSKKSDKSQAITKSSTSSADSGVYSEVIAINKGIKSDKTESKDFLQDEHVVKGIVDTLVLPDISDVEKPKQSNSHLPFGSAQIRASVQGHHSSTGDRRLKPDDKKPKEIMTSSKTYQHLDGTIDDANHAGKITDTVFQFLDSYLSEDEGTDNHSAIVEMRA
ncbi:uncharacterized protein LOC106060069 isoform X3 [Biomphalaria glabrata]|uniref:Uncharacterized protein LOC106060069 isoform X3 n=1 Tax=Biomphalaria glabrata TaxID=6526 RepID=A0A9U8E5Y2_BIOGL|nr:uncharacterized protein LOC106060069 isoform X3 [Biomphalaria glabrata]XP_013073276.2 uncharacterized protein LOC106060069 isoform X3 [Biomphalaria glabrata]XP_013073277.2 uncharacterized protein LOC106060069 isoform X3 [Biomphalaria glabrata]XP_013073282.2 uncharacterized protein LOC106060069 isoform X3 [Biomphalaria glabrata]XP_013073283.2 uncharacterized protein LOC106060069 isoform X3 [Biomphalaria glabrata]XP_013073285.2 uncharacterized protein LOC106060069 isoform X3 [Biomphalaria gla